MWDMGREAWINPAPSETAEAISALVSLKALHTYRHTRSEFPYLVRIKFLSRFLGPPTLEVEVTN
jgi:hypothetical protein